MAHIRKHPVTGRPQVRWRDPSGRERSKTFVRATDARAYKAMVEAEASRGELWDRSRGKTPFNEEDEVRGGSPPDCLSFYERKILRSYFA